LLASSSFLLARDAAVVTIFSRRHFELNKNVAVAVIHSVFTLFPADMHHSHLSMLILLHAPSHHFRNKTHTNKLLITDAFELLHQLSPFMV
jgi:hypothetical protein